jgi:hypothetical protein
VAEVDTAQIRGRAEATVIDGIRAVAILAVEDLDALCDALDETRAENDRLATERVDTGAGEVEYTIDLIANDVARLWGSDTTVESRIRTVLDVLAASGYGVFRASASTPGEPT